MSLPLISPILFSAEHTSIAYKPAAAAGRLIPPVLFGLTCSFANIDSPELFFLFLADSWTVKYLIWRQGRKVVLLAGVDVVQVFLGPPMAFQLV